MRLKRRWLVGVAVLLAGVTLAAQRNAFNMRMRTDASGYLLTSLLTYTSPDGPLTNLANLRLKTDANGYLLTTMHSGEQIITPVCDGVTDDTAVIQAALTAGGRVIIAKSGTCMVSTLTISNAVILSGLTQAGTIIKSSGTPSTFITVSSSNVGFRDLTLDGTGATSIGLSVLTGLTNISLDTVAVLNVSGAAGQCAKFVSTSNLIVSNSKFAGCGNRQFWYDLTAATTASHIILSGNIFDATGMTVSETALEFDAESGATGSLKDVHLTDNTVLFVNRGATETDGIVFTNALTNSGFSNVTISGGYVAGDSSASSTSTAIEIKAVAGFTVQGVTIENTYIGIQHVFATGPLTGNGSIVGNYVTCAVGRTCNFGIYTNAAGFVTVTGNFITGPFTYGISGTSAGAVIEANVITLPASVGVQVNAADVSVIGNFVSGAITGDQCVSINSNGAINSQVKNNHCKSLTYGIQFNQGGATNTIVSDNTFTSVSVSYNGTTTGAGLHITDDSLARITTGTGVSMTGQVVWMQYKATITNTVAACITAATTCDVTIATLPAKTILKGVYADLTATFTCGATCTTATLSGVVGRGSGGAEFLASMDLDASTTQFGDVDAEMGTQLTRAAAIQGGILGSWAGTTNVVLRITSGTGNLGTGAATNLNAGSITFYLLTERLQ